MAIYTVQLDDQELSIVAKALDRRDLSLQIAKREQVTKLYAALITEGNSHIISMVISFALAHGNPTTGEGGILHLRTVDQDHCYIHQIARGPQCDSPDYLITEPRTDPHVDEGWLALCPKCWSDYHFIIGMLIEKYFPQGQVDITTQFSGSSAMYEIPRCLGIKEYSDE